MSAPTAEVVTIGETMGLFFSTAKMPAASRPPFHLSFGGAETNVAIGVARLGHSAAWIGRLGNDEVGAFINRELRAESVTTAGLFGPGHTGLMVRAAKGFGRTAVQYSRAGSAGSHLSVADIPADTIESSRVLHLTGITAALGDGPLEAILHAARIARAAGTTVSLDVNYRAALWPAESARFALRELATLSDVVFATADEAEVLLGGGTGASSTGSLSAGSPDADDALLAERIRELGPREIVLKRGAEGALSLTPHGIHAQHLTRVVEHDPVGAGDAFAAGYIHGILVGSDPQERLDFAGRVAAHSVTVVGDWEGLPRLAELSDDSRDILR